MNTENGGDFYDEKGRKIPKGILRKISDLMQYSDCFLDKMPRQERSTSGWYTKFKNCLHLMADNEIDAEKSYTAKIKAKYLDDLDRNIEKCRFYLFHMERVHLITEHQWIVASGYVNEIGKMTGKWILDNREKEKDEAASKYKK